MHFNFVGIFRTIGAIMIIFGTIMLVPALVSVYYSEPDTMKSFLVTGIATAILGFLPYRLIAPSAKKISIRDGYLIVGSIWILLSFLGAIPFVLSGALPTFADGFFETASGLTTTGASVSTDVEAMPKGILLWRGLLHWMGGMGVLVFAIALMPALGLLGNNIAHAETPGPTMEKLTPKLTDMAKILYLTYIGFTLLETACLVAGGMSLFDSFIHSMASISTGGFANYGTSIGYYNSVYIEVIVILFMFIGGVNFNLYYRAMRQGALGFIKDSEFKGYVMIISGATLLIAFNLLTSGTYEKIGQALRLSLFQVVSIMTTTGFSSADFDLWPTASKLILLILMFVGGCASSTSGAMKVVRILVVFKLIKRGISLRLHPQAVVSVKLGDRIMAADTVSAIASFMFTYLSLFVFGVIMVSFNGFDLITSISATAACLGNVGPGLSLVGPMQNYSLFAAPVKVFLSFLMLAGRLELFTIVMLFTPKFWNPDRQ